MKLPSEILAFKLLRRANISKEEITLVLTGMNYGEKETLYEEAKKSLKKFKGDIVEGSVSLGSSIKFEPAFLAEHEEALLAAGYVKQFRGGRGAKAGRGSYRGSGVGGGGSQRFYNQQFSKKMNPVGPDGKPLTCRSCGSYRHLVVNCPHSWENMAKTNVNERMAKVNITEEENVVLFTGYNKTDIAQLGFDARNCAVLDSACSSTVCGENWLDNYINSLDKRDRVKVQQSIGQKIFKFGGGS